MKVLVTGGAGYIGAVVVNQLIKQGHQVVVVDNLIHGDKNRIGTAKLIVGDIGNKQLMIQTLKQENIELVMHFAAFIEVGESMQNPYKYFQNNTANTLNLLEAMVESDVKKFIFSSTAAVYGNPKRIPVREDDLKITENPYGESKLLVEQMLPWFSQIHNINYIIFRYFNAAGAGLNGELGNFHTKATHLIPNLIKAALHNREFTLNGNDYATPDGTCIRDYIHVVDLAKAHIMAIDWLNKNQANNIFNVGTGRGYSNLEVLKTVEKILNKKIQLQIGPRRPGDPAKLIANSQKLQTQMNWKPEYSDLETIVSSACKWHKQQIS